MGLFLLKCLCACFIIMCNISLNRNLDSRKRVKKCLGNARFNSHWKAIEFWGKFTELRMESVWCHGQELQSLKAHKMGCCQKILQESDT